MLKIFFILILIFNVNISFSDTKETYKQLSIFNEVYNRVKNQYVEEVTDKELIEKALNGMLQALDPHSSFMSEEIYKEMQMDTSGSFGGLGIEITIDKGFIKVVDDGNKVVDDGNKMYKKIIESFSKRIINNFERFCLLGPIESEQTEEEKTRNHDLLITFEKLT